MDLFAHEIEMHPLTSWYEEFENASENLADTPELAEDCNMDLLTPEKRKAEEELESQPKMQRVSVIVPNPQVGAGQVEKEKNPQNQDGPQIDNSEVEHVDRSAFNEKLFSRQYKHRGSNDILVAGQQYKDRIMRLLDYYMKKHGSVTFFMVYECKLLKYNQDGEEEYSDVYFHSRNRRLIAME